MGLLGGRGRKYWRVRLFRVRSRESGHVGRHMIPLEYRRSRAGMENGSYMFSPNPVF